MAVLNALIGPVTGLLDKFIQDKDQKARLKLGPSQKMTKEQKDSASHQYDEEMQQNHDVELWHTYMGGLLGTKVCCLWTQEATSAQRTRQDEDELCWMWSGARRLAPEPC